MPALIEPPTPAQLRAFKAKWGLTWRRFAELLGIELRTIEEWGAKDRAPALATRALRDLDRELGETTP